MLALVFLGVLYVGGEILFAVLVALASVLGVREYLDIVCPETGPAERAFSPLWAGAVVLGFLSGSQAFPGALVAVGSLVYFLGWIVGPGPSATTLKRWGATVGSWIFVAFFLGHAVWVRRHGAGPVVFAAMTVWSGDIAAYYVGTAFGTHRLAPSVSPKKSVEGAVASIGASLLVALVLGAVLPLPHSLFATCLLAAVINVAAQIGDLAESLLKRCGGVKDSGALLPGHGGVLDRIDGFVLSLPIYAALLATSAP